MKAFIRVLLFSVIPILGSAELSIGIGKTDLTPPLGTPSAGYTESFFARALFIDNGDKKIVLCSVDHLGFTYDMVQSITEQVHCTPALAHCDIYIAASHTHFGGDAHFDIPLLGESLADADRAQVTKFYIQQTVEAILQAHESQVPAKMGLHTFKDLVYAHVSIFGLTNH